jgi:hypothetical protein
MSLLQNKFFVTLMAIVAVAAVGYNLGLPAWKKYQAKRRPAISSTTTATSPLATQTRVEPSNTKRRGIDRSFVASRYEEWLLSPARDPFAYHGGMPIVQTDVPPAASVLKLQAVWRQTGGRLAVVNQQILREGEVISFFLVEKIDADAIWVLSPNGSERVSFDTGPSSPATPLPASSRR